eukprot:UN1406
MRALGQERQLDNAPSYEHFAQEVATAAWGCADNYPLVLSFSCTPIECTCPSLAIYCEDPTFGAEVRSACPGSCGQCLAPVAGTVACKESTDQQNIAIGDKIFQGSCASFLNEGRCADANVRRTCPISCGVCTKVGCRDDPNFTITMQAGVLKCKDWWNYTTCPPSVELFCPTACRKDNCTR